MKGWKEAIDLIKYTIEYGLHCNDLTMGEIEDNICFALEQLAEKNGEPEIDWEWHEEDGDVTGDQD